MTEITLAGLLRAHRNIKAKQADLSAERKTVDAKLKATKELIETKLLQMLQNAGSDQLKVKGLAIVTPTKKIMPNCKDWPGLWTHMKDTDNFDLVSRRLSSKHVEEYMKAHDGALPPGITIHVERGVTVTRQN